jgi:hypothetical protein
MNQPGEQDFLPTYLGMFYRTPISFIQNSQVVCFYHFENIIFWAIRYWFPTTLINFKATLHEGMIELLCDIYNPLTDSDVTSCIIISLYENYHVLASVTILATELLFLRV